MAEEKKTMTVKIEPQKEQKTEKKNKGGNKGMVCAMIVLAIAAIAGWGAFAYTNFVKTPGATENTTENISSQLPSEGNQSQWVAEFVEKYAANLSETAQHDVSDSMGQISDGNINITVMDSSEVRHDITYMSAGTDYTDATVRSNVVKLLSMLDTELSEVDAESAYTNMLTQGTVVIGEHLTMTQFATDSIGISIDYAEHWQ